MNNRCIILALNVSCILSGALAKQGIRIVVDDIEIPEDSFFVGEYYCHKSQNFYIRIYHPSFEEVAVGAYPKEYLASIFPNVE